MVTGSRRVPFDEPELVDDDTLFIEELPNDDFGYDGDVEIVKPDQLEEPESDLDRGPESEAAQELDYNIWQAKLAEKLKSLNCHSDSNDSRDDLKRPLSRKRRSRDPSQVFQQKPTKSRTTADVEVTELKEASDAPPRAKRRKWKRQRSKTADRVIERLPNILSGPNSVGNSSAALASSEDSPTTSSSLPTAAEDAMELDA